MTDKFLTQRQLDEYVEDLESLIKSTAKMANNKAMFQQISDSAPRDQVVGILCDIQRIQWALEQAKKYAASVTEQVKSTEIIK